MNLTVELDQLIERYSQAATKVISAMHEAFGEPNLIAAWRAGRLAAAGDVELPGLGSGTYRFHGRGCYVDVGSTRIDIELSQDEDCIGFDSWRLCRFAEESLGLSGLEPEELEAELRKKVADGALGYSMQAPYFGLYFLPVAPAQATQ